MKHANMQSRLLRHFLAVYQHMNITVAADALAITQPGLTKSIQLLEAELGVSLFDRLPNGVVPTRYGEALAKHVTTIFLEYDHAMAEIESMRGGSAGTIRIGAGPIWLTHFLTPAVVAFQATNPGFRFSMEGQVISTAIPALLRGEIELFCGSLDFPDHPEIIKREVDQIEHVVLAGRDHPLTRDRDWKPQSLLKYPWATLSHDTVGRRQLAAYFATNGLNMPQATLESTSIVSILQNVQQGEFLACLARPLLDSIYGGNLVVIEAAGVIWRYQAGIALRKRPHIPSSITRFVDCVISTYYRDFKSV